MANILLVENEPVLAGLIRNTLRVDGHQIGEASSPLTALELDGKRCGNFDLILTELNMGAGLAKLLSRQNCNTKIMFMTDHMSVVGAIYALWDQVSVLEKPFTADELRRTVRDILVKGAKRKSQIRLANWDLASSYQPVDKTNGML